MTDDLVLPSGSLLRQARARQTRRVWAAMLEAVVMPKKGESALDFQIRQTRAQRDALAHLNPDVAAALNTKLLQYAEMKFQQSRLTAKGQRAAEQENDLHTERLRRTGP